ncbi:hypothetical protein CDD81_1881 [Ophiocordyceps australis]|uniref:Tubby C-terminal domain-containing protein n=1 Tax=Ophiocordyceps australis TaxID=1399860 RepID=A0A2C5Y090_9HYPO|nr:hypothetical protein CDD81_1881 [Ophiocordyceps australis]
MAATTERQFVITRNLWRLSRHYSVVTPHGDNLYYVERSVCRPGKADLTMHLGPDKTAPVAAVCHMPHLSGNLKIGLGDPSRPEAMQWEDMIKQTLTASEYQWAMTDLPQRRANLDPARTAPLRFAWKRTHSVAADGLSLWSLSTRNYKLIDLDTGQRAAVFTSDRTATRCGVLQIDATHGPDFDLMVIATCLGLYEKAYRRSQSRGSGS